MINDNTPAYKTSGTILFYSEEAQTTAKAARDKVSALVESYLVDETPVVWNQDDMFTTALCFAGTAGEGSLMANVIAPYLYGGQTIPGVTMDFKLTEPTSDENVAIQSFGTVADNSTYQEMGLEILNRTWAEIAEIEASNRAL